MAISLVASGAIAYLAGKAAPAYPTGIVADDLLVAVFGHKPPQGYAVPTGWTLAEGVNSAGGFAQGVDTGDVGTVVFYKVAVGNETGTLANPLSAVPNVGWAQIHLFRKTALNSVWSLLAVAIRDNSGATPFGGAAIYATGDKVTGGPSSTSNLGDYAFNQGDLVFVAGTTPTDVGAGNSFSAEAVAWNGPTSVAMQYGVSTEINEPFTALGNDLGGVQWITPITSGLSSAGPPSNFTATATVAGTTTNQYGGLIVLRMRENVPPDPSTIVNTSTNQQDQVEVGIREDSGGTFNLYRDGVLVYNAGRAGTGYTTAYDTLARGLGAPYANHTYTVKAYSPATGLESVASNAVVGSSIAGPPASVAYSALTGGVKVSFVAKTYPNEMEVWVNGALFFTAPTGAASPLLVTGLTLGQTYSLQTRTKYGSNFSDFTPVTNFTVTDPLPVHYMKRDYYLTNGLSQLSSPASAYCNPSTGSTIFGVVDAEYPLAPTKAKWCEFVGNPNSYEQYTVISDYFEDVVPANKVWAQPSKLLIYFEVMSGSIGTTTVSLQGMVQTVTTSGGVITEGNPINNSSITNSRNLTDADANQWLEIPILDYQLSDHYDMRHRYLSDGYNPEQLGRRLALLLSINGMASTNVFRVYGMAVYTAKGDALPVIPAFQGSTDRQTLRYQWEPYADATLAARYNSVRVFNFTDLTAAGAPTWGQGGYGAQYNVDPYGDYYPTPPDFLPDDVRFIVTDKLNQRSAYYTTTVPQRGYPLPGAPDFSTVEATADAQLTLTAFPSSLYQVQIWRRKGDSSQAYLLLATVAASAFPYVDSGLTVNEAYSYFLRHTYNYGGTIGVVASANSAILGATARRLALLRPASDLAVSGTSTVVPTTPTTRWDKLDDSYGTSDRTTYVEFPSTVTSEPYVDFSLTDPAVGLTVDSSSPVTIYADFQEYGLSTTDPDFDPASGAASNYGGSMGVELWQGSPGTGTLVGRYYEEDFVRSGYGEQNGTWKGIVKFTATETARITNPVALTMRVVAVSLVGDDFNSWPDMAIPRHYDGYNPSTRTYKTIKGSHYPDAGGCSIVANRLRISGTGEYNGVFQVRNASIPASRRLRVMLGPVAASMSFLLGVAYSSNLDHTAVYIQQTTWQIQFRRYNSPDQFLGSGTWATALVAGDVIEARYNYTTRVTTLYRNGTLIATGTAQTINYSLSWGIQNNDGSTFLELDEVFLTADDTLYHRAYETVVGLPMINAADPPAPLYKSSSDSVVGTDDNPPVDKGVQKASSDVGTGVEGKDKLGQSQLGKLIPDAIIQNTGFTGTVEYVQNDPATPDAFELVGSDSATSVRVSFQDPPFPVYGVQHVRLRVRQAP